jgi:hypothetical protein
MIDLTKYIDIPPIAFWKYFEIVNSPNVIINKHEYNARCYKLNCVRKSPENMSFDNLSNSQKDSVIEMIRPQMEELFTHIYSIREQWTGDYFIYYGRGIKVHKEDFKRSGEFVSQ